MIEFNFHYSKKDDSMCVEYNDKIEIVKNIKCWVPVQSEWRSEQSRLVLIGKASYITIKNDLATIL